MLIWLHWLEYWVHVCITNRISIIYLIFKTQLLKHISSLCMCICIVCFDEPLYSLNHTTFLTPTQPCLSTFIILLCLMIMAFVMSELQLVYPKPWKTKYHWFYTKGLRRWKIKLSFLPSCRLIKFKDALRMTLNYVTFCVLPKFKYG